MRNIETGKMKDLKVGDNFEHWTGEVVEVELARPWGKEGNQQLQQTIVGDETGFAKFTLFDDRVGMLNVGDSIRILNGWTNQFNGQITLNLTKKKGSDVVVITKGNGTSKLKYTPQSEVKGNGTSTFDPKLSSRQTAVQASARVLAQSSTSAEELLEYAEKIEAWLTRP